MPEVERTNTLRDVAKLIGCSVATVSNAINGRGRMSEQTREEILRRCEELNFVPNSKGRSLRLQRTDAVGVIYAPSFAELFANVFYARIMEGLAETFGEAGIDLMLGNRIQASGIPTIVREGKVDALMVLSGSFGPETYESLRNCPVPVCLVDDHVDSIVADSLTSDGFGGGRLVAQHLIEQGHRKVAMIAYDTPLFNIEQRIKGFVEGLREAGIDSPESELVIRVADNDEATALLRENLKQKDPLTAVFAVNDTLAFDLVSSLSEAGISIPDDLSVIGFDDDPIASRCNPPLTTIDMAKREYGVICAKLVLERLPNPKKTPVHQVQPIRLVIRDTVKKR